MQDDLYFARGKLEGINVDFLLTRNKFFQKIQRSYQTTIQFFDRPIPCATVEGLLLLKMYALPSLYRQGNLPRASLYENDILNLLYNHRPSLVTLWPVLAKYLSESDFDAVTAVVSSIEARIALFRPNNQTS